MTGRAITRPRRALGFSATSVAIFAISAGAGAPAPLLPVYQHRYAIADSGLTAALVVYIVPAALALSCAGRLSDHLGRRPVSILALGFGAAGALTLVAVHGLGVLLIGRVLQGLATGLGLSSLGAYAVDLAPPKRPWLAAVITSGGPAGGLALGALISGALVQFAPDPEVLIYLVIVAVMAPAAMVIAASPETQPRSPGAIRSLRPTLVIPQGAGAAFMAGCCCFVAAWALGSFYQALGPTLAAEAFGHRSPLFGGLVVAAVMGTSALVGPLAARVDAGRAMILGCGLLALGVLGVGAAVQLDTTVGFLIASGVAGIGFGASFVGGMRRLLGLTPASDRAGVLAAAYLISYLAAAVPSYGAGVLIDHWGLRTVTGAYLALVLMLVVLAVAVPVLRLRATRDGQAVGPGKTECSSERMSSHAGRPRNAASSGRTVSR